MMSEYERRQLAIMFELIASYRNSSLSLNSFIGRFDAAATALDNKDFSASVRRKLIDIEQINAEILNKKRSLTREESAFVLDKLEELSNTIVTL